MAWRELDYRDRHWLVSLAAERRPQSEAWVLAFFFRTAGPDQRSFWASYPIESLSKAALFTQAEQVSTDELLEVLAKRVDQGGGKPLST